MGSEMCIRDRNIGPLNRAVLLDCDFFVTPVAQDLFSLRALSTVGRSAAKWINDYQTIRDLAPNPHSGLLSGEPHYLGYIASAFKVKVGKRATNPHAQWENKIAPRVVSRVVNVLADINPSLVPSGGNKIGGIKHYQSLAPSAQENGVAFGQLKGLVNSGYNSTVQMAAEQFEAVAKELVHRMGSAPPA